MQPGWKADLTLGESSFCRAVGDVLAGAHFDIHTMRPDGSDVRQITTDGTNCIGQPGHTPLGPGWSPDGSRIVFDSVRRGSYQIYTMWPDGSHVTLFPGQGNNATPRDSPDGNWLAFSCDRSGQYEVWIMRADGTDAQPVNTASAPYQFLEGWVFPQ